MSYGPTYGMWTDTVDEMNETVDALERSRASLKEWKEYAQKLETSLAKVNEMFRDRVGAEAAQAGLKDLALQELQRLDPTNKLLDPEYRKVSYDKLKDECMKTLSK
ncbi:hypothetical protein GCM10027343_37270 [Noviherbaspirillum agri]